MHGCRTSGVPAGDSHTKTYFRSKDLTQLYSRQRIWWQQHQLYIFFSLHQINLDRSYSLHEPDFTGSLCEKAVAEESDGQEDEGVGIDHVPPQRLLRGVRELLLQLGFFFWGQFDCFCLFQPAEAHHRLLAQTLLYFGFCEGRDESDEGDVLTRVQLRCICLPGLCTLPSMSNELESCWLLTQTSRSRSTLSSVRSLRLQTNRYNWKMEAHKLEKDLFTTAWCQAAWPWMIYPHVRACRGWGRSRGRYPG